MVFCLFSDVPINGENQQRYRVSAASRTVGGPVVTSFHQHNNNIHYVEMCQERRASFVVQPRATAISKPSDYCRTIDTEIRFANRIMPDLIEEMMM